MISTRRAAPELTAAGTNSHVTAPAHVAEVRPSCAADEPADLRVVVTHAVSAKMLQPPPIVTAAEVSRPCITADAANVHAVVTRAAVACVTPAIPTVAAAPAEAALPGIAAPVPARPLPCGGVPAVPLTIEQVLLEIHINQPIADPSWLAMGLLQSTAGAQNGGHRHGRNSSNHPISLLRLEAKARARSRWEIPSLRPRRRTTQAVTATSRGPTDPSPNHPSPTGPGTSPRSSAARRRCAWSAFPAYTPRRPFDRQYRGSYSR